MKALQRTFYNPPATQVAPALLGARLVRRLKDGLIVARIIETEAYLGEEDLGCHAHAGRTARNAVMYGPPGHAYVYFTYGMHWMLNAVTGAVGEPAAVLIRAIQPLEGLDLMTGNRSRLAGKPGWLNGPAKLTQALAIDRGLNAVDLCDADGALFIAAGETLSPGQIETSARIGLYSVPEPWKSIPWRFTIRQDAGNEILK